MDFIAQMLYAPPDKAFTLEVTYQSGTLWLRFSQMATLLQVTEAELMHFSSGDNAFSGALLKHFCHRQLPLKPDGKKEPHCRFECFLLLGQHFQSPHLQHFSQWAKQQIELGMEMEKACADNPMVPPDDAAYESDDWLEKWRQAAKETLLYSKDPCVWEVLKAHWLRQPLRFVYWGGSNPGEVREVIPKEVFRADGYRSTWFRGDCPQRGAERTFNIEKVELCITR